MAFVFQVKVVPRSGKNGWQLDKANRLKCYLKSPPERGEANDELIKIIAKALKIKIGDVQIISGASSRDKLIKISIDLTFETLLSLLGIEQQLSLLHKEK